MWKQFGAVQLKKWTLVCFLDVKFFMLGKIKQLFPKWQLLGSVTIVESRK